MKAPCTAAARSPRHPTYADEWTTTTGEDIANLADRIRDALHGITRPRHTLRRAVTITATGGIELTKNEARTMLRAIAPTALTYQRGGLKLPTSDLQAALGPMCAALVSIGRRDPCIEKDAIRAGLALHAALGEWLDAMRWKQATSRAGVAWPKPKRVESERLSITAVTRQSPATGAEQPQNSAPVKPRRPRAAAAAGQGHMLLPIAGKRVQNQTATEATEAEPPHVAPLARHA